ncbi:MAG: hypothetical protein ACJAWV_002677 [Flammeovirgaceae bacterium]|jgi:hypothetical protein
MNYLRNLFATLFLLSIISTSFAQSIHSVQIDAFGIGKNPWSVLRGSYEKNLGKKFSFMISAEKGAYHSTSFIQNNGFNSSASDLRGWGIMPQFRLYFTNDSKNRLTGLFFGTHFRYRRINEAYDFGDSDFSTNWNGKANAYNYGVNFGFRKRILESPLTFEVLFGLGKAFGKWENDAEREQITGLENGLDNKGNTLNAGRIEVNLGWIFPYRW